MQITVRDLRAPLSAHDGEILEQAAVRLAPLLDKKDIKERYIFRRSVDTRHKTVTVVCSVAVVTDKVIPAEKLAALGCAVLDEGDPMDGLVPGGEISDGRPVIVGFGPCGMFAALILAEMGYRPIVIERGDHVLARAAKVRHFLSTGELDTETNIQFGAGGAGTFSDGKLVTRINDRRCRYVLERFAQFGAPREILMNAKPHIGTDRLLGVVAGIDSRIRELGGEIRYNTKLTGISVSGGKAAAAVTDSGEIKCGQLILATGHSARDTYAYLMNSGFAVVPKPFSVGVRIEHLRKDIERAIFRGEAGNPKLGHAEYTLSKRVGSECVYTFCMCPGGEVIAAASEEGGVVTNGMSRFRRDGVNSNAAIAVSVAPDDPIGFQRRLERAAFETGGGGYAAPVQTVGDFLSGKHGTEPSRIRPTYMNGNVKTADLAALFPENITKMLKLGIKSFDANIAGFSVPDAVLTGVETRTSAPVRVLRGENMTAVGYDNIYPCGEGAGYAGGITSAAVDGIKCAETVISRFRPCEDR